MNKKFGLLSSSIDPQQLSATVSGAILSVSAILLFLAHQLGFNIGTNDITNFAQQAGLAVGFMWMLFGIVRKVIVSVQQKWATFRK